MFFCVIFYDGIDFLIFCSFSVFCEYVFCFPVSGSGCEFFLRPLPLVSMDICVDVRECRL